MIDSKRKILDYRDFVVFPIVVAIIYLVAYTLRPSVTDEVTRRYFFPALTVKIAGALIVGLVYQFYYGGGDTFNYHTYGSRYVWEAFWESPMTGFKLIFNNGYDYNGVYKYASKIPFFRDPPSYNIVKIAAICDLFTFSCYSATAALFAAFCFVGMWQFFLTFYEQYPHLHKGLAIATFFIPSVFFWGSGLLKDTITLGCLGIATFQIYKIFIVRQPSLSRITMLLLSFYGLYAIKIYILLTFLPAAILWVFLFNLRTIRSQAIRTIVFPFVLGIAGALAYFATLKASEDNPKYAISSLARTAQETAYDIRFQTGKDAGSGYTLGELDGTLGSMLALAPQAINVSIFRPYLWEARNPFMILSALESFALLLTTLYLLWKRNLQVFSALLSPNIFFCLLFSLTFAFAVGVSTYNFGTLVRYKIPLMPFFVVGLMLMLDYSNRDRNVEVLEPTEY
ncbi:hypothetical protein [Chryseolinea soli]|uniref:hypothetical protein n=1 Tax=Chryseolinea soli TaxID=2321403 RepID=UPI001E29859A|nr:hypothetical protein [Chryseolinea soli]